VPTVLLNPDRRRGLAAARALVVVALCALLLTQPVAAAMAAGGRIEREPSSTELAQQQNRVTQLRADEQRKAAAVDDAQGAMRASALLAGQALDDYSTAVRALQARQLLEQSTQDTLTRAQSAVDSSRRELGRWARQAYQGGTGIGADPTLNTLLLADGVQDVATNLVVLKRIGRDRGMALVDVRQDQARADAASDRAATASQEAATAAIKATSARDAADQAVDVQRRMLGIAETALAQTRTDVTAAARRAADLRAASALAQARAAGSAANRDNRVTGQVGSCTGGGVEQYSNGAIPISALCPLWAASGQYLRADAAYAFDRLAHAYADRFGRATCITDSYRSYASQVSVYARKPNLAAVPGTSNHGWGTAVDLCGGIQEFDTVQHEWMVVNAPLYGWFHPGWAEPGGTRPEPWHWEYAGV
jgi:D-alanyl-D-alanine carboxypeptidase